MATMTPDEAYFLGFVVEAILYGMYAVLFAMALNILIGHPRGKPADGKLTMATVLLFVLCTSHFALNFDNKLQGLITKPGLVSISDETPELFAGDIIVSITDFFGQLVLIYRCWLIWGKQVLVTVLPTLIACAALACAMAGLGMLAQVDPTAAFPPPAIKPLGTSSFVLSLGLNILVTGLIIGRIWYMSREARNIRSMSQTSFGSSTGHRVRVAMAVMVESGVLYLVVQLVFVVLFSIQHPATNLVGPMTVQIYGIAPTLIIVRVRMSSDPADSFTFKSASELSSSHGRPTGISVHQNYRFPRQEQRFSVQDGRHFRSMEKVANRDHDFRDMDIEFEMDISPASEEAMTFKPGPVV